MNHQIFKYTIPVRTSAQPIVMPAGAELLHAHEEEGEICIWALVDSRQTATEKRFIFTMQTGARFDAGACRYIGTAHLPGPLVFHVLELKL